ncbi:MAG TPA: hypothetical protein VFG91_11040 [Woeseiaceae bacterium]|nr:hypothetical protein [Woeseiaceae bacterium]
MFEHLKTNADHLAADAAWLRRERDTHARQGFDILRRRVGSPPGLVVCFGAGVFAGARSRNRESDPADKARRESHLVERLLHGPVGAAAIKLGTAFLAGALLHPDREPPPPPL